MSHVGLTCSGCFMEEKKLVSKLAGTVTSVRASVSSAVGTDRLQDRQTDHQHRPALPRSRRTPRSADVSLASVPRQGQDIGSPSSKNKDSKLKLHVHLAREA